MWARRFPRIYQREPSQEVEYPPTPHVKTDLHSPVDNECLISPPWQATKSFIKDVSPSHRWYFPFQKVLAVTLHPRQSLMQPPPHPILVIHPSGTLEVSARSFSLVTRGFNHILADKCETHGPFASVLSWFHKVAALCSQGEDTSWVGAWTGQNIWIALPYFGGCFMSLNHKDLLCRGKSR